MLSEEKNKLKTKQTNRKAHVEIKAGTLPSLALSGSRLDYVIHMFIVKMVKQKKKRNKSNRQRNPTLERLSVCLLAVES